MLILSRPRPVSCRPRRHAASFATPLMALPSSCHLRLPRRHPLRAPTSSHLLCRRHPFSRSHVPHVYTLPLTVPHSSPLILPAPVTCTCSHHQRCTRYIISTICILLATNSCAHRLLFLIIGTPFILTPHSRSLSHSASLTRCLPTFTSLGSTISSWERIVKVSFFSLVFRYFAS